MMRFSASMQLGNSEEIVLSAAEHTEFQLPSASEGFGADAVPDAANSTASEYQLPSASEDLSAAPSVDAANGASEYQLPSASDELIPEAEAATGASEFQLPDASSDFGGSALSVGDTAVTGNEYQSSDVAADLLTPSLPARSRTRLRRRGATTACHRPSPRCSMRMTTRSPANG